MSALDLLATAEHSSDLRHHERFCDVDILGAVGMATIHTPTAMILYRLKYLNDAGQITVAKAIFIRWARRVMLRRAVKPDGASRVGVQALTAWLDTVCHTCHGRKRKVIEGTPALSATTCSSCNGTGKPKVRADRDTSEVIRDIADMADSAITALQAGVSGKLGKRC